MRETSDCTRTSSESEFAASMNWQTMQKLQDTDFITLQATKNLIDKIAVSNAIEQTDCK